MIDSAQGDLVHYMLSAVLLERTPVSRLRWGNDDGAGPVNSPEVGDDGHGTVRFRGNQL